MGSIRSTDETTEGRKQAAPDAPAPSERVEWLEAALQALPKNCDGLEQEAFEAWAQSQGMNMQVHPLHYLFMDPKTNAARTAWNECIRYCRSALATRPANPAMEG